MISEEDLSGAVLAGKTPAQQFRFIERLAAKRLVEERDFNGEQLHDDYDYMSSVLEAARVFRIDELLEWEMPPRSSDEWQARCRNFRAEATRVSQRILFEYAARPASDPNTVALSPATKERLRFHLNQVRAVIDAEPIPDWKKTGLYDAIAELEREIDKARTRISAVVEVLGKVWDGDVPVTDALRQVVIILEHANESEKASASLLARPIEPKKLEAPKAKNQAPLRAKKESARFEAALDDDIPF